ncbi:MAG: hypothetical protein P8Z79_11240 [Sedimentisphaerales bacterium]|jgi:hypothetical protein
MTMDKMNLQNKFSFGPSQEDEGRKKTLPATEGTHLTQDYPCPVHPEAKQDQILATTFQVRFSLRFHSALHDSELSLTGYNAKPLKQVNPL